MKLSQYLYLSLLLIAANSATKAIQSSNQINTIQKKHTIIFDLTNVVIKENQTELAKKIGYKNLASYTLTHWKHPGHRCLDMLNAMSSYETQKPHITISLKKRVLPRCLVELQEGKKTCSQAKNEIADCITQLESQKFFTSNKEKCLLTDIINLILDPTEIATLIEPVKPTIHLIEALKKEGHKIYLCANAPEELYATAHNKFPDLIKLFDGIVISSHIKTVKPNPDIFSHLLNNHHLNPADCILIDDLEESATAAKSLGMNAIIFNKISQVKKELKKYGIKVK